MQPPKEATEATVDALIQMEARARDRLAPIPYEAWLAKVRELTEKEARARLAETEANDQTTAREARFQAQRTRRLLEDLQRLRLAKIYGQAARANGTPPASMWPEERPLYERAHAETESLIAALGAASSAPQQAVAARVAEHAMPAPAGASPEGTGPGKPSPSPARAIAAAIALCRIGAIAWSDENNYGPAEADDLLGWPEELVAMLEKKKWVRRVPVS